MVGFLGGLLRRVEDCTWEVLGVPLKKGPLSRLVRKGYRAGVLFRCWKMGEFKFVKLAIRLVGKVRSFLLAVALAPLVGRLFKALENVSNLMVEVLGEINYWMRMKGREYAEKVSRTAAAWGNRSARNWPKDAGFIRYLTIMNLHKWKAEANGSTLEYA